MLMRFLIILGMLAIGVLVWKLLQRQERGKDHRGGGGERDGDDHQDRFGW